MKLTPEQRQFRDRIQNADAELARIATHLDILETKSAAEHGITAWEPDTALAYATALVGA